MLLLHTGPLRHRHSASASLMDPQEITSGFTRGRGFTSASLLDQQEDFRVHVGQEGGASGSLDGPVGNDFWVLVGGAHGEALGPLLNARGPG